MDHFKGGRSSGGEIAVAQRLLPLIGGATFDLTPRMTFTEVEFAARWRPGATIGVYCAGNRRLAELVRPLRLNAYAVGADPGVGKVGTGRDIARRVAELGQSAYASVSVADPVLADAGFRCWSVEPLPIATVIPSPGSPVRVVGDGLECLLPATLTTNAFDKALAKALGSVSLAGWASSAEGQAVCAAQGIDPGSLVRGTRGPGDAVAWSTELVLIRPRHDASRLLRLCEQLIIDHVMTEPMSLPSARATEVPTMFPPLHRSRVDAAGKRAPRLRAAPSRSGRARTR
ncbi:hypothetical protein [Lichenihabitans psoromatis]|uniref:hypothetical protein n=1 Tax=Lichenihabitans psoromatis TaxID=2528642 RepID=UPI0010355541|nr:hypothetical protein [Lichenihabitans psoromatis]